MSSCIDKKLICVRYVFFFLSFGICLGSPVTPVFSQTTSQPVSSDKSSKKTAPTEMKSLDEIKKAGLPKLESSKLISPQFFVQTLTMLLSLSVVLLLIYLSLRWLSGKLKTISPSSLELKVIHKMPLEAKKNIWVLAWKDTHYLVASTEQSITLLDKISQKEESLFQKTLSKEKEPFQNDKIPSHFEVVNDGQTKKSSPQNKS